MLDILRKHASSWMIKIILGAIIITFAFFFGYSAMRRDRRSRDEITVAKVNGEPVPTAEFEFYYDRNFDRMRKSFEDKEVPDFARKLARDAALQQSIARMIVLAEADRLGLVLSSQELADVIRQAQAAEQGGEFDPLFYRRRFLPFFKNRYGMDYEGFVGKDLKISAFEEIFSAVDSEPLLGEEVKGAAEKTAWTFETIAIDPNALVEAKLIESADKADELAAGIIALGPRKWKKRLGDLRIEPQKIGPLKISERHKLMDGHGSFEDFEKIFVLTPDDPVTETPIRRGGKLYIVRLIGTSQVAEKTSERKTLRPFFEAWMSKQLMKAKVENYLEQP